MGKAPTTAVTAAEMKRKKKKGRPSKNPLPPEPAISNSANRRSTRRNPNNLNSPPQPELDDDEDERKEKKVKLVVRLPQSDEKSKTAEKHQQQQKRRHSRDFDSGSGSMSGSESDPESDDGEGRAKKRKINGVDRGSDDGGLETSDKEVVKATDTPLHGSPFESGPTTPLPDKMLLVFILDRLQKKDTYGVYSEPVDPNELPDYFDIIEKPMDFGTVRKKLHDGVYKNLEELEADVFLICSNAMKYNAPDTVYYRQARTIQELAKRDFNNLKLEGDNGEPQPKVVRRGRPPSSKTQKKSLETSPVDCDHVRSELSSGATLANAEDKATGSNSYNLRKGSALFRFRSADPFMSSYSLRTGENHSELLADWNNEFPASILRADMKYGKKQFMVDENRRDTYRQYHPLALRNNVPVFPNSIGNMKQLVPVGFQEPFAYARSLARFAANLGPIAWKIASKKIEAVLPSGVHYGHGWVGDRGAPSQPLSFSTENHRSSNGTAGGCNSSKLVTPLTSDLSSAVAHGPPEGVGKLKSQNEVAGQDDASSWRTQFPSQQNPMHQSYRNGFSGTFGYELSARVAMPGAEGVSGPPRMVETPAMNHVVLEHSKFLESTNTLPHGEAADMWNIMKSSWQQRHNTLSGPPDLNVRVPAGSPSSSLQIGSPKQPDLALQL